MQFINTNAPKTCERDSLASIKYVQIITFFNLTNEEIFFKIIPCSAEKAEPKSALSLLLEMSKETIFLEDNCSLLYNINSVTNTQTLEPSHSAFYTLKEKHTLFVQLLGFTSEMFPQVSVWG